MCEWGSIPRQHVVDTPPTDSFGPKITQSSHLDIKKQHAAAKRQTSNPSANRRGTAGATAVGGREGGGESQRQAERQLCHIRARPEAHTHTERE